MISGGFGYEGEIDEVRPPYYEVLGSYAIRRKLFEGSGDSHELALFREKCLVQRRLLCDLLLCNLV